MIIQQTFIGDDGRQLVRTYSNENRKIIKVGTTHMDSEFIYVYPCKYTYLESSVFIEPEEMEVEDGDRYDDTGEQDNLQE